MKDCFEYIIAFITDGTVGFQSDYLDNLPDDESMCLVVGSELRTGNGTSLAPEINFEDINNVIHKLDNTFFTIQFTPANKPIIRLENDDFFRDNTGTLKFEFLEDLLQSFDTSRLYANITLGSNHFKKDTSASFSLPYVPFLTHVEETYQIGGVCNTDADLNLVSEYVYCNNRIESVFAGNDDFDDDIFIIQYTKTTSQATQGFYLTEAAVLPALYNERMLNSNVSERHKIHGELAKFFGTNPDNDKFRASTTSDGTLHQDNTDPAVIINEGVIEYDDDFTDPNFDTGGNFNTVLFRYVAPALGFYFFESHWLWRITENIPGFLINPDQPIFKTVFVTHHFHRHNAAAALLQSFDLEDENKQFENPAPAPPYQLDVLQPMFLEAGDFVDVEVDFETSATATGIGNDPDISFQQIAGSFVLVTYVATGGGVFSPGDADRVPVALYEFDKAVTDETWQLIKADVSKSITINNDGETDRVTFPGKVTRNLYTGVTEWENRADLDQNNI